MSGIEHRHAQRLHTAKSLHQALNQLRRISHRQGHRGEGLVEEMIVPRHARMIEEGRVQRIFRENKSKIFGRQIGDGLAGSKSVQLLQEAGLVLGPAYFVSFGREQVSDALFGEDIFGGQRLKVMSATTTRGCLVERARVRGEEEGGSYLREKYQIGDAPQSDGRRSMFPYAKEFREEHTYTGRTGPCWWLFE